MNLTSLSLIGIVGAQQVPAASILARNILLVFSVQISGLADRQEQSQADQNAHDAAA